MKKVNRVGLVCIILLVCLQVGCGGGDAMPAFSENIQSGTPVNETEPEPEPESEPEPLATESEQREEVPFSQIEDWILQPSINVDIIYPLLPLEWRHLNTSGASCYESCLNPFMLPDRIDSSRVGSVLLFMDNEKRGLIDYEGNILYETDRLGLSWFLVKAEDLENNGPMYEMKFDTILYEDDKLVYVLGVFDHTVDSGSEIELPVYLRLDDNFQTGNEIKVQYFDASLRCDFQYNTETETLLLLLDSVHGGGIPGEPVESSYPFPALQYGFRTVLSETYFKAGNKYGFVQNNQVVVPFEYDRVRYVFDGIAAVKQNNDWFYITMDNQRITDIAYSYANEYILDFQRQYMKQNPGYTDQMTFVGNMDAYGHMNDFSEGLAAVNRDGKYGYINTAGEEVITCQYEAATPVYNGRAWVKADGLWGIADMSAFSTESIDEANLA